MRSSEAEPLFSAPKHTWVESEDTSKCICSEYIITVDSDIKSVDNLGAFDKSKLMSAPGFFFILSHVVFIIHTSQHNAIFTRIYSSFTSSPK